MATKKDGCPGIIFDGGVVGLVKGGNIFSNSGAKGPGSCYSGIITGGSGKIAVTDGSIKVAGGWQNTGGAPVSPAPEQNVDPQDIPDVPVPNCDHLSKVTDIEKKGNKLVPGKYDTGISLNGGDWTMDPGMYCLYGDFSVGGNANLSGEGVMIVMYSGSISIGGSVGVYLKRPSDIVDGKGQHYGGMLIFMPKSNTGGIDLSGSVGSNYMGTIYAPGDRTNANGNTGSKEKCQIGGNNTSIGVSANVMCSSVKIHGNATVSIIFKEEENYRIPPSVELAQ